MADDDVLERTADPSGGLDTTDARELEPPKSITAPPTPPPEAPRLLTPERVQRFATAADEALTHGGEGQTKIAESAGREVEILRHRAETQREPRQEAVKAIDEELRTIREHPPEPPAKLPERPKLRYNLHEIMGPPGSDKPMNRFMDQIGVLAAVSGRTPQERMLLAVTAFNGMIDGWAKGKQEDFQQRYNEWKDEVANIKDTETRQRQYIQDVLNNAKDSSQLKSLKLQMLGQEDGDALLIEAAVQKQWGAIDKGNEDKFKLVMEWAKTAESIDKVLEKQAVTQSITPDMLQRFDAKLQGRADWARGMSQKDAAAYFRAEPEMAAQRGIAASDVNRLANEAQARQRGELAGQTTAARIEKQVEDAVIEVRNLIPQTLKTSRALARGNWTDLTALIQKGQEHSSNVKYNEFLVNIWGLSRAYGRAMNPRGQPRVSEEREAQERGLFWMALGQDAFEAQLKQVWFEVNNSLRAAKEAREGGFAIDQPFPGGATPSEKPGALRPGVRSIEQVP